MVRGLSRRIERRQRSARRGNQRGSSWRPLAKPVAGPDAGWAFRRWSAASALVGAQKIASAAAIYIRAWGMRRWPN